MQRSNRWMIRMLVGFCLPVIFASIFGHVMASDLERESLVGLRGVLVTVDLQLPPDIQLGKAPIRAKIELCLRSNGILVLDPNASLVDNPETGLLGFSINILKIPTEPIYAYSASCNLKQPTYLARQRKIVLATTWEVGNTGYAGSGRIIEAGKEVFEEMAEQFANDFLAANPKPVAAPNANTSLPPQNP